jgi:hypothetical protein
MGGGMTMFRAHGLKIIDRAHSAIGDAEMRIAHSYTDAQKAEALDELYRAQRFLRRACDTWKLWQATDHDDYEAYPDVPEIEQAEIAL